VAIDIDCGHSKVNHEISSLTPKLQPTQFSLLGLSQRAGSFIEFIRARNMATGRDLRAGERRQPAARRRERGKVLLKERMPTKIKHGPANF